MTVRPPVSAARLPDDQFAARVREETTRIYMTSGWVPPVGTGALTITLTILLRGTVPGSVLGAWVAWLAMAVLGAVALLLLPALSRWQAADGVPRLAYIVNGMVGVAYGSLLWLDPVMVDVAEWRWLGLVGLFALSAGVSSGFSGLHLLAMTVIGPAWTGAAAALLEGRQWIVAGGGLMFLGILFVDHRHSGELWRELVDLRIDHELRAEEHRWWAEHDELTGLLNRSGLLERVRQRDRELATVLYIDLDHFKQINDACGHDTGDEVLVEVARRLGAIAGEGVLGRLGGDEFVLVAEGRLSPARIDGLGARIIEDVEQPIQTACMAATVSVSVGVASGVVDAEEPSALVTRADHALLTAKRRGRRRVEID